MVASSQRAAHLPFHIAGPGLSPALVAAYSETPTPEIVEVQVSDVDLEPVRRGHANLEAALAGGAVYGLSTGVGALRHVKIEQPEKDDEPPAPGGKADSHALRLWRSHAGGLGAVLGDEVTRATMLVRLHQLLRGGSGVAPAIVETLAEALRVDALPTFHTYGAVGTADLTVLAELGLTLVGELPWRKGSVSPAPVSDGDGLPLLSSNAMTAAVGSLAVVRLQQLARLVEEVAAISHLALRGAVQAYDPRVHEGKDDPYAAAVAARMWALLDSGTPREGARLQDPFGLRTIPQVHSALEDGLDSAHRALVAEIGARAENPLSVDGAALHHGQSVSQRLAFTLDSVRAAAYPAMNLSVGRLAGLLNADLTGLPTFLAGGAPTSSGLMIVEYVAADLLSRIDALTTPMATNRTIVSLGLEEHASHSTQAAWATLELADLLPDLLACELVAAVRALRMDRARAVSCPARSLFERADEALPHHDEDHVLGPELQAASTLVQTIVAERMSDAIWVGA